MKDLTRKRFLEQTISALPAFVAFPAAGYLGSDQVAQISISFLESIRDSCREELFDRFLPAMDRYVIDHEFGGFLCELDILTGERRSTEKRTWYEGRDIWLYSTLYSEFGQNAEWLKIARQSREWIIAHRPVDGGFWPGRFSRKGELVGDGDIFADLYLAEGLAAFARASGEPESLLLAIEMVYDAFLTFDSPDYRYHTPPARGIEGPRVLNHWMILLYTAVQILEQRDSGRMREVTDRSVEAVLDHHLNPDYRLLNDTLHHDYTLPEEEDRQVASVGLAIQALWMVMEEAVRRGDTAMFNRGAELFRRHVDVSRDHVYGGHFRSLNRVADNVWSLDKALGVQEEVLIGALILLEHTGALWAVDCYVETERYARSTFRRDGYKFWIPGGDRKVERIQEGRAEHYHHPRRLIFNLLAAERILERTGRISGKIEVAREG